MEIPKRFDILIQKTYYIYERYHVDATFALLYHARPLDVETLGSMIRRSDEILRIDDNYYFLIFTFTPYQNALKACENLVEKLDHHFHDKSIYVVLDTFDTSKSPMVVLNRLQQILCEARKHSYSRIENEEILDNPM